MKKCQVTKEALIFYIGALIYPKDMAKNYPKGSIEREEIQTVHDNLYRFSLKRMHDLINNAPILLLILKYLKENNLKRISSNPKLSPQLPCYKEAFDKIFAHSSASKRLFKSLGTTHADFVAVHCEEVNK
jgi:hypothetical protein